MSHGCPVRSRRYDRGRVQEKCVEVPHAAARGRVLWGHERLRRGGDCGCDGAGARDGPLGYPRGSSSRTRDVAWSPSRSSLGRRRQGGRALAAAEPEEPALGRGRGRPSSRSLRLHRGLVDSVDGGFRVPRGFVQRRFTLRDGPRELRVPLHELRARAQRRVPIVEGFTEPSRVPRAPPPSPPRLAADSPRIRRRASATPRRHPRRASALAFARLIPPARAARVASP